jgi:hypothetical protein
VIATADIGRVCSGAHTDYQLHIEEDSLRDQLQADIVKTLMGQGLLLSR